MTQPHPPLLIGHRGAGADATAPGRDWPENTLPSFIRAFALGADEVETDLALSRDRQVFLRHDEFLPAPGGPRRARDLAFSEICTLCAGTPLLGEVLEALPDRRFVLELKRHSDVPSLLACLQGAPFARHHGRLRFISFEREALRAARSSFPNIPCAWIATSWQGRFDPLIRGRHIRQCREDGFREICGHWRLVSPSTARHALEAGLELGLGPVNTRAALSRCLRLGAGRLYTDRLETVRGWLRGSAAP